MSFKQLLKNKINSLRTVLSIALIKRKHCSHFDSNIANWKLFERIKFYNNKKNYNFSASSLFFKKLNLLFKATIFLPKDKLNSTFIQSQIDTLSSKGGGTICLPAGTYQLENSIFIKSHVTLTGIKEQTTLVFYASDYAFIINSAKYVGINNLIIKHLGKASFCSAIYITHAKNIFLKNIDIEQPRATGFLIADKVTNISFSKCKVDTAGLTGYMFIRDCKNITLTHCSAENCDQSGIFFTDLKLPKGVAYNDFDTQLDYTHRVIGNFAPFDYNDPCPFQIKIKYCRFRYNRKMGITTDGVGYLEIINSNIAHNDNEGITIDNGTWCCLIKNCHIYDNGRRARQSIEELDGDFVAAMGLMADKSSKAKLPGISIDNAAYIRIEKNKIKANWGDGIKCVRATYACIIKYNNIENNNLGVNDKFHFFGVLLANATKQHKDQDDFPATNNIICYNNISGTHFSGIHLLPGTSANTLYKNNISGFTFAAIENHTTDGNCIS